MIDDARGEVNFVMSQDDANLAPRTALTVSTTSRPPFTILFVDPDRARAERLADAVRATCVVGMAPSAYIALEALRRRLPDLIVTELDLPDMGGVEFITRVHGDPVTRHVLIMVVTNRTTVGDKIAALTAGADDFIVRPVTAEQFLLKTQLLGRFRRVLGR
jgi:DNA-binding response OmpR family regulator